MKITDWNTEGQQAITFTDAELASIDRIAGMLLALGLDPRNARGDYVAAVGKLRCTDETDLVWEGIQRGWRAVRPTSRSPEAVQRYRAAAAGAGV